MGSDSKKERRLRSFFDEFYYPVTVKVAKNKSLSALMDKKCGASGEMSQGNWSEPRINMTHRFRKHRNLPVGFGLLRGVVLRFRCVYKFAWC